MDMQSPNTTSGQTPSTQQPEAAARPLSYAELEELAERILERMKKETRLDMQREGKHS